MHNTVNGDQHMLDIIDRHAFMPLLLCHAEFAIDATPDTLIRALRRHTLMFFAVSLTTPLEAAAGFRRVFAYAYAITPLPLLLFATIFEMLPPCFVITLTPLMP